MPKIIVKKDEEVCAEFPIKPFQTKITIGSEGDNDLIINDDKVSFHHLMIDKKGTRFYLIDRGSTYGTLLNDEKIERRTLLGSGDEIKIGDYVLLFENILFENETYRQRKLQELISDDDDDRRQIMDANSNTATIISTNRVAESLDTVTNRRQTRFSLVTIYGPYAGKRYRLNQGMTRIGRDSTLNDIVIRKNKNGQVDHSISRRHATIIYEDGDYYIFDKRSKTRTCVNGQLLQEDVVVKLKPSDEIEIISDQENTIFRFLPDDIVDNSVPKYNNDWMIRNASNIMKSVSLLVIVIALVASYFIWQEISRSMQKPSPLEFKSQLWIKIENGAEHYNRPEEIASYASMMTPAVGDLNDDGINDLLFCDKPGHLHAIDGRSGKPLWDHEIHYRISFPNQPVIADLNGDEASDIVIPSHNSVLYAIDGRTGYEIWNSELINGEFASSPAIGDLNGNGLKDVVFSTTAGEFYIGLSSYKTPDWVKLSLNSETNCVPLIGDIDGDNIAEAMIGTNDGHIYIYDAVDARFEYIINVNEEMQKAKGTYYEDHKIVGHLSMGDLNGDKIKDLVIITDKGTILTLSGKTFQRMWYDEIVNSDPFTATTYMQSAVGGLNNDDKMEVVVSTLCNSIVAYCGVNKRANDRGVILWQFTPKAYDNMLTQPVLADMNKDGYLDVITTGIHGGVYILDGRSGKSLYNESKSMDIDDAFISIPLVADMNGDRKLDLIVRDVKDQFHLLSSNAIVKKNSLSWPQLQLDECHSAATMIEKENITRYTMLLFFSLLVIIGLIFLNYFAYQKRKRIFQT